MAKTLALAFVWFGTMLATSASAGVVYDAAADFSVAQNPNGAWQYGYSTSLGGTFIAFTDAGTIFGNDDLDGWRGNVSPGDQNPVVVKNFTSEDQVASGLHLEPGMLALHPGPSDEYSIVRWTAPADGIYDVQSVFEARDRNDFWAADVHVLINGIPIFNETTAVRRELGTMSGSYAAQHFFSAGGTVDFVVGSGFYGYLGDTTGLHASILEVPEPSSAVLFASIGGLHWVTRRRRFDRIF